MTREPRKISLAQAVRQGDTVLQIFCVTRRKGGPPYSGGPNVCGHLGEMPIDVAIARYWVEASLSDVRGRCTKCGGRDVNVRARGPVNTPHRHF